MATVLDFSILSSLSIIFIFIAVFVGGWGLLYLVNPFGFTDDSKKKIYAVLAFALSFIVILSPGVLAIFTFSIPWLSVVLLIAFFMLFFARVFNPGLDASGLIEKPVVWGFLVFFTGLVFLFGMGAVFGQGFLETQPGVTDGDRIVGDTTPTDTFVPADQWDNTEPVIDSTGTPVNSGGGVGGDSYGDTVILTLFHPKILGMLFMMLLATVTILLIAR